MTDEQIAQRILNDLWPKGTWKRGAEAFGIAEKTFGRICKGGAIKSENWEKLRANQAFREAFALAKKEAAPQLDDNTKEAMIRLAQAAGPSAVKGLTYEFESLTMLMGPEKAVTALSRLVATAREVSESAAESPKRQKTS